MSDDAGLTPAGRRRRRSPSLVPELASPLENEDTLSEILLRLSPAPSSLPRASVVCKRWRRLVSDPAFLRRFRARHRRNAPVLGFFRRRLYEFVLTPTLDPPDRIPPQYFPLQLDNAPPWSIICCRHGLVLLHLETQSQYLVWDPVAGDQHHVAVPPELGLWNKRMPIHNGAVLRAAGDANFKVVLLATDPRLTRTYVCVYSSDTGIWGDLISISCASLFPLYITPSALVGGSLYWVLESRLPGVRALEFDLDRQCLAMIEMPLEVPYGWSDKHVRVMQAECGDLGFLYLSLSSFNIQLWKRKTGCDGGAGWVLGRTIELRTLLPLGSDESLSKAICICGFVEDKNVLLLGTGAGTFMIQLDSIQSNGICSPRLVHDANADFYLKSYLPFTCVVGMRIGGRQDGAELLQNA